MADRSSGMQYALLTAAVFAVALLGFAAFVAYLQLDLRQFAASGLVLVSVAAGIASFFSPCSFPLLVTLLARETGAGDRSGLPIRRSLQFAAAMSVGVTAFLLLLGGAIAFGAGPRIQQVTFTSQPGRILRAAVGSVLILLGLGQASGLRIGAADRIQRPLRRLPAQIRRRSPTLGLALFGFSYVLAGFG